MIYFLACDRDFANGKLPFTNLLRTDLPDWWAFYLTFQNVSHIFKEEISIKMDYVIIECIKFVTFCKQLFKRSLLTDLNIYACKNCK